MLESRFYGDSNISLTPVFGEQATIIIRLLKEIIA